MSSPRRLLAALVALALAVALVLGCTFTVPEGESALVLRFGSPAREIDEAGLYFKLPPPVDAVARVDRRLFVLDPEPSEYLTGDKKNVVVDSFLAWSVADPLQFYKSVNDRAGAEARLSEVLGSVVGDVLSSRTFASMVSDESDGEGLREVADAITRAAAEKAGPSFGVRIEAARIKRMGFPAQNERAVFQRMEAERAAIAGAIRSEGLEQYERIKAEADREEACLLAEAERAARELRGAAEAEAARIYAEAQAKDPELYGFLRSLEVLEKVLGSDSTLILSSDHELVRVLRAPPPAEPAPAASGE